jgi:virulence-associated protein VapD
MIGLEVQHYLGRARDFLQGMNVLAIEEIYELNDEIAKFKDSLALLGIHCAVSYSDALRTGLGCTDVSSEDHRNAASDLKSRLASRKFENLQGADRLGKLLSKKNLITYAAERATESEIKDIVLQAQRFSAWAEEAGKALRIEGW